MRQVFKFLKTATTSLLLLFTNNLDFPLRLLHYCVVYIKYYNTFSYFKVFLQAVYKWN